MNILITGGCGYVGSALIPELLKEDHKIRVVDLQWFGGNIPAQIQIEGLGLIKGDIRDPKKTWFKDIEAVIHLAGISNDPSAEFRPDINYSINAAGTAILAQMAKEEGVKKFIFASTCSVYGFTGPKAISKESEKPSAKFPYGISKLMAEQALTSLEDTNFNVVILRKGTIGGGALRMRLDLIVNTMTKSGLSSGTIHSKHSSLWRPLLDIRDAVEAYKLALLSDVRGIYNIVGQNRTVLEVAKMVQTALEIYGVETSLRVEDVYDLRNYKASGDKALKDLGFSAKHSVGETVKSVLDRIEGVDLDNKVFYNIKVCKEVLK